MSKQEIKILVWAGVGIAVLVVVFILWKKISAAIQNAKAKESVKDTKDELNKSNLTKPESNYTTWANELYTAMNEAGTDYEVILSVLKKLQNADDWKMLFVAFGTKTDTGWFEGNFKGDLAQWLIKELRSGQLEEVRKILSAIGVEQV